VVLVEWLHRGRGFEEPQKEGQRPDWLYIEPVCFCPQGYRTYISQSDTYAGSHDFPVGRSTGFRDLVFVQFDLPICL